MDIVVNAVCRCVNSAFGKCVQPYFIKVHVRLSLHDWFHVHILLFFKLERYSKPASHILVIMVATYTDTLL